MQRLFMVPKKVEIRRDKLTNREEEIEESQTMKNKSKQSISQTALGFKGYQSNVRLRSLDIATSGGT